MPSTVTYTPQGVGRLLKRWGFTPQRPIKKAYEQRPAEVKTWMEETYPQIQARAKAEGADVFWGDETSVQPEAHRRRGYAPKGCTPTVKQPARRFHSSVISAISNRGKLHWMPLKEALNSDLFIEFLQRLIKHRKRKIFLIVDNLRVHHSRPVKDWLEANRDRIEVFYLPSYSPELNPDEYLNQTLKHEVHKRGMPTNPGEPQAKVELSLDSLQHRPKTIQACFQHPAVKYAA
ncbi:MAG: IS630 family transposase [Opitutales bacterium]